MRVADTSTLRLVVVSGIPAGSSGTGRLVAHLEERMTALMGAQAKLVARPERPPGWQLKIWLQQKLYFKLLVEASIYLRKLVLFWWSLSLLFVLRGRKVILLHPQNLGYGLTLRLIASLKSPPLVYLLDSSFFCISSYNHVSGEGRSCIRCIEVGCDELRMRGCKPFPRRDWAAIDYVQKLQTLVKAGDVKIAAQNERQAQLAKIQFEIAEPPPVIGLWTNDWNELFDQKPWNGEKSDSYEWDVLFHGHYLDAKGACWTLELANKCPGLKFFFPFERPKNVLAIDNCTFASCTWETGLKEKMKQARFVIVPSLWSAPIEGALVKSLLCADAVAVVQNPTSFSDELPEEIVLKLSAEPEAASKLLNDAVLNKWRPDRSVMIDWIESFEKNKTNFFSKLTQALLIDE